MSRGFFETMDSTLVNIYEMENIEEINFSDIVPFSREGNFNVLPTLYVRYNGGKVISLCSKDKYFDIFVKRTVEVYNHEKAQLVKDSRFGAFNPHEGVKMDEKTRTVLESGNIAKIDEIYSFYADKRSYPNTLVFQSDEFRLLLPIVKYHLKQLFELTGTSITIGDSAILGYISNYSIDYKIDGIDDQLLINFDSHNNSETSLFIRSRNNKFQPLEMNIVFNHNGIIVREFFKDLNLYCENNYEIREGKVTDKLRISRQGEPVVYKSLPLDVVDVPYKNITSLDSEDNFTWFKLPWDAYYGVNDSLTTIADVERIANTNNKYLSIVGDEFILREYASKEYRRIRTTEANASRQALEEVYKRVYGILLDNNENIYLLETYFADTNGGSGYYDANLNERYFCHVTKSNDRLAGIKRENLRPVSDSDDILMASDLLEIDNIRKLLRE